ncbi:hypothetical protein [Micromonospora wenchangensis]|uniref:hypothetical protein n=1 Tax=Micromonospora wenchangensis TaxID=1185415 RepID=UPI003806D8EB
MSSILDRIDNTIAGGLCPCGATPRPGSPYCSWDCEPTHISRDTDTRQFGRYATPMRWRPDLVTAADDTDLTPIGSERIGYTGPHRAQIYEHASNPTVWHLRLDDGHRYVGCDLVDMGTPDGIISIEQVARIHDTWQRLERELGNIRHLEPDDDPWRDWFPQHRVGSYHQPTRSMSIDLSVDPQAVAAACERMRQTMQQAMEAYTRQLVQAFEALQETFRQCKPMLDQVAGEQPPTDPMERALWLRKNRNTGPATARLDGRRRRR